MNTCTVVNVRSIDQFVLYTRPVVKFKPSLSTFCHRSFNTVSLCHEQLIISIDSIETADGNIAGCKAEVGNSRTVLVERTSDYRFAVSACSSAWENTAVP